MQEKDQKCIEERREGKEWDLQREKGTGFFFNSCTESITHVYGQG